MGSSHCLLRSGCTPALEVSLSTSAAPRFSHPSSAPVSLRTNSSWQPGCEGSSRLPEGD